MVKEVCYCVQYTPIDSLSLWVNDKLKDHDWFKKKRIDKDNNGVVDRGVDFDEFCSLYDGVSESIVGEYFNVFDRDNSD